MSLLSARYSKWHRMAYCVVCLSVSPIVASLLWDTHFLSGFDIFHGWSVLTPFHWKKICICYRPPPCVCIRLCVLLFSRTRRSVPVTGEKRLRKRLDRKTILKPRERKCQRREGGETSLWSTLRDELIGVTRSAFRIFFVFCFLAGNFRSTLKIASRNEKE
jgi:hypothetical protein